MTCVVCEIEFMPKVHNQKYCDSVCQRTAFNQSRRKILPSMICQECGITFVPKSSKNTGFCTATHKQRNNARAWARANIETNRKRSRDWGRQNKDKVSQYQISNRTKIALKNKEWRLNNSEKRRFNEAKRRARKRKAPGTITLQEWADILSWHPYCVYCLTDENLTMEHILPLARGGAHSAENITVACLYCNSSKGDSTYYEWRTRNVHRK